jgi:hypothetical protein
MPALRQASISSVPAGGRQLLSIDCKGYVCHFSLVCSLLVPIKPLTILSGQRVNFRNLNFQPFYDIMVN